MIYGQIMLVGLFVILALWRRDIFLYAIGGAVSLVFGLMWRSHFNTPDGMAVSIALIALGVYLLIMAIYNLVVKFTK